MAGISRKDFLKGAALASAGLLASNVVGSALAEETPAETQSRPAMKIVSVEPKLCSGRWLMVRIETDTGIVGWGECGAHAYQRATAEVIRGYGAAMIGSDPFKIEWWWNRFMRNSGFTGAVLNAACSGIDYALWDIKGKALGVPVWELLGGENRNKIRCYTTCSGNDPQDVANNVKAKVDEGWKYVRVRLLHGKGETGCPDNNAEKLDRNEKVMAAIRETAGWDVDISLEAHRGLNLHMGIELGKLIDKYRIHFYEDPVIDRLYLQKRNAAECKIALGTGERFFSPEQFNIYVQETNVRFLRPDMCVIGGLTGGMKVAHAAEPYNINLIPHNPLGPISTVGALHIDTVIPNFEVQEWPSSDLNQYTTEDSFKLSVDIAGGGYIPKPEGVGLCVDLPDDVDVQFPFTGRYNAPGGSLHEDGSMVDR